MPVTNVSIMSTNLSGNDRAQMVAMCDAAKACENEGGRVQWLQSATSLRNGNAPVFAAIPIVQLTLILTHMGKK